MKETETQRKCIVCGELKDKTQLLRFVLTPDNMVVPDLNKKLPGKGVYVSVSKSSLRQAVEKNLFAKAFKVKAKANLDLVNMVESVLRKKGLDSINLARKAGVLLTGFEKVMDAIKKGKVAFLLEATDAGADGSNRVRHAATEIMVYDLYSTMELDKALDKVNTVHAAFVKSEMSKKIKSDFDRLKSFIEI